MNIQIRYYTRTGNTEKLANAVASALGLKAEPISEPLSDRIDLLFLGTSYYAFDMDPTVKEFLLQNKDKIGKVVCFGTSAMMKSMKGPMRRISKAYGISFHNEEFHCKGRFKFANKNKPDENDLRSVAEFAKRVAGEE